MEHKGGFDSKICCNMQSKSADGAMILFFVNVQAFVRDWLDWDTEIKANRPRQTRAVQCRKGAHLSAAATESDT